MTATQGADSEVLAQMVDRVGLVEVLAMLWATCYAKQGEVLAANPSPGRQALLWGRCGMALARVAELSCIQEVQP